MSKDKIIPRGKLGEDWSDKADTTIRVNAKPSEVWMLVCASDGMIEYDESYDIICLWGQKPTLDDVIEMLTHYPKAQSENIKHVAEMLDTNLEYHSRYFSEYSLRKVELGTFLNP